MSMKLISTDEAAERLGVSGRRVRQLIDEGKLIAQYVGGGYVIDESMLESVRTYGKPGRPPGKTSAANKAATGAEKARNGGSTKKKGKR